MPSTVDLPIEAPPANALAINGGEAVAYALKQIDPEVVAAYPITPQTLIIEKFAEYFANGEVRTEFVTVESEHAALSVCVGAAAAGGRAVTATAGPGLALMFEMLGVASGMRLPIVMHLCTRALSSPINILGDHSDAMAMRETGWVMLAGSSPQEAYDQALIAQVIAEHPDVLLPTANLIDGFSVTHAVERVNVLDDSTVREFVGEYEPGLSLLSADQAVTFGAMDARDSYFEHKRQQVAALERAVHVTAEALDRFAQVSGRRYRLLETYRLEDAAIAIVVMGSLEGQVRAAVDTARERGLRVGALRIRLFRPFPTRLVANALRGTPVIGVLDRAIGFGSPGNPLYSDIAVTMFREPDKPMLKSFVYGLGGRVTTQRVLEQAIQELADTLHVGRITDGQTYLGLHEGTAK
ncbi:MAG: pyruvate ferredoxin oxidoreductase [Chloroflexi bacterium]|nr:pyruvate ferredoxin oxidoreductase [Chloroflexota bacterium]